MLRLAIGCACLLTAFAAHAQQDDLPAAPVVPDSPAEPASTASLEPSPAQPLTATPQASATSESPTIAAPTTPPTEPIVAATTATTANAPPASPLTADSRQVADEPKADMVDELAHSRLQITSGDVTLRFQARVIAGWEYEHKELTDAQQLLGQRDNEFDFFLNQARFTVGGNWGKPLSAELDLDFSSNHAIRDAWLNFRVARPFQVRVGQFKRPFSRIELIGAGHLPMRSRGLSNHQIVGDLGYGGRSLGAQLWGRIKSLALEWAVCASNPPPEFPGVDLHARVVVSPVKWLAVGLGGAHKIVENRATTAPDFIAGNAASADIELSVAATRFVAEAMIAQDLGLVFPSPDPLSLRNYAASIASFVTHEIELSDPWQLQPLLFGEWLDSNLEYSRSEAVRFVGGVNILWHKTALRLMPQLEVVRPLRSSEIWQESTGGYIVASAQL